MVKEASILFLIVIVVVASLIEGSRILVSVPFGTKSHKNMYVPLVRELANRGHNITVITNYMTADFAELDNVRETVLAQLSLNMSHYPNVFDSLLSSGYWNWGIWGLTGQLLRTHSEYPPKVTNLLYDNPKVQRMLANDYFDLVIASQLLLMTSAPLAWHFKAPLMVLSPNTLFPGMGTILGDGEHTSYVPFVFSPYTDQMNLGQRILNTLANEILLLLQRWYEGSTILIVKENAMPECPPVDEIIRNVTMVLINSHPSFTYPRCLPPQVIEVGGIHCRSPKPLPQDLETFVSGVDGFLLFSVGSLQNMEDMPEHLLQSFIRTFSRLPLRIVWQWKGKIRADLPANVLAIPWLPQQDLLGHHGCRAFITHGGLNSLQEAVYHGVPMLGIPFGIDQFLNLGRAVNDGYALQLEWKEINENTLITAIHQLLFIESFSAAAARLSRLLRDQMETPLERAVFWTEFVIRHNGSVDHLRLGSRELAPYQRSLIDVYFILLFFIPSLPIGVAFLCLRNCCSSKTKVKPQNGKNKEE